MLAEVASAWDMVHGFRDRPAGRLRLNVPVSVARLVLPRIVPAFLAAYPDICLEVIAEDRFVDLVAEGDHACLRGRHASGAITPWGFERDGESVTVDPKGPLTVGIGATVDLAVEAAAAGSGIVYLFEDWLRPYIDRGELEPVLEPWWQSFSGPFLYYPGRRHLPGPLRAFVDFASSMRRSLQPVSPGWKG